MSGGDADTPSSPQVNTDGFNTDELIAVLMSREVRDWETSACGAVSHLPAAAMLLAEATHAPHAEVIILGSEQLGRDLGKDIHFLAQRGKLRFLLVPWRHGLFCLEWAGRGRGQRLAVEFAVGCERQCL